MIAAKQGSSRLREWLTEGFTRAEDVVYIGLGLLLVATAFTLLVTEILYFSRYLLTGALSQNVVLLLDRILLIIMLVEILYTVQVSFQQHTLHPEPFLVVGLIAVTRRILVLTAEFPKLAQENESAFRNAMIELGLLTILIVALVLCLRILRQRHPPSGDRS